MKKLLLILLCLPMIGFGQIIFSCGDSVIGYHDNSAIYMGGEIGAFDFNVNPGENFQITNITLTFWLSSPTNYVTSSTMNYYSDSNGSPGQLLGYQTITPYSSVSLGQSTLSGWYGYEITANINPITFYGQSGINTKYWIGGTNFYNNNNTSNSLAIEITNTNVSGDYCYVSIDGGLTWSEQVGSEYAYRISGNCITTPGCTDSTAINYDSLATIDDSSCVYCDLSIDSLAVTQMTCFTWNNASVNIIATGTQPLPYNYYVVRLNPTDTVFQGSLGFHSGLSPGIYVASVVDSLGCFDSDTFTINSLDSVYIDTVIYSNPSCNGMANGYISAIIPMGGTPPYQFSLNGGLLYPSCLCVVSPSCPTGYVFSGLAPGTYTVEIWDSNMCANSYQIIITNPSASIDTVIINPASCFGAFDGSITLTLSGGAPPYSFNWTGPSGFSQSTQNISSLYAGSYACIISDMTMCQYTTSFQVLSPNPLYYTISNVISETCYGYCDGQITINATGGTWPYYYDSLQANVWPIPAANQVQLINDTLIDSLCSGAHMIYLTDSNGCEGQVLPGGVGITTITSGQQNTSSYDTVSVTLIYVWNGMTLTVSGDYFVTLTNSAGCDSIAYLNLTITNTTGLLDVTNTEKTLLKITDILGQETPQRKNTPLFYIYNDGTVEKRIIIE